MLDYYFNDIVRCSICGLETHVADTIDNEDGFICIYCFEREYNGEFSNYIDYEDY